MRFLNHQRGFLLYIGEMKQRIAIYSQDILSAEVTSLMERLSSLSTVSVMLLTPSDICVGRGLEFDFTLVVSNSIPLLLRMEGFCANAQCVGRLLALVSPERHQMVQSVLLPTSVVFDCLDHVVRFVSGPLQGQCCVESPPSYHGAGCAGGSLSKREEEILSLWVNGLTNKEVAWKLGISVGTLAAHRRNLYRKTGLATLSQLVVWGLLHGIGT